MKKNLASIGLMGLAYGGIMVMTATDAPRPQVSKEAKEAAKLAGKAHKALNKRDAYAAIVAAEQAVALEPQVAAYRMLLGQGYLQAGRFVSAEQAFADVLQLDGSDGKAALNLALTQIAEGDWQAARGTLTRYEAQIPASDRGLAMALAGDTAGAVGLLTEVARSPEATAKVRQNLALSYALAGQWQIARVVAAADMSPADVDARMVQWAQFAQPQTASDQVASLLGVQPVADGGQPAGLALNAPVAAPVAVAMAEAPVPVAVAEASAVDIVETPVATVAKVQPVAATATPVVRFGPRQEVVQTLTATLIDSPAGPIKVATRAAAQVLATKALRGHDVPPVKGSPVRTTRSAAPTGGNWYVQLGAFDSAGVAKDSWARAQRRFAGFKGVTPHGMNFKTAKASFYRLSVGGFSRAGADGACRQYRANGGQCFVRSHAGDQVAAWVKPGVQLAMR
ncbi:SPOR domain-containing protein [Sphingomonas sp.]|jgi:Flp pilus assembly protein TadD|uniref:SPOR domain-containing protein n=1 Tax=Sphingomonas sp. TaxID=28214 RepID=UPI002D804AED|nr:SPOR domain-containing protein [Sphingomonas sp.]HEU0043654.1 SPOR domain-containing protein [Sphingomonas sp.]